MCVPVARLPTSTHMTVHSIASWVRVPRLVFWQFGGIGGNVISSLGMDRQHPDNRESKIPDTERIAELTRAADEQITRTPEITTYVGIDASIVAHIIDVMAGGEPFTRSELQVHLRECGVFYKTLRIAEIEAALEIAERLFAAEATHVVWAKETIARSTQYRLESIEHGGTMLQLVEVLLGGQDIPQQLLDEVFGQNATDIFGGRDSTSLMHLRAVLREQYKLSGELTERCIAALEAAGCITILRPSRGQERVYSGRVSAGDITPPPPTPIPAPTNVTSSYESRGQHNKTAESVEAAWHENPYRELAVIAVKRLAWQSAREGISLSALHSWMDADGVTAEIKERIITVLVEYGIIAHVIAPSGELRVKINVDASGYNWSPVEGDIRRIFS